MPTFSLKLQGDTNYQSDATCFLQQLKQQDPGLPERQKQGHALLWYPKLPDSTENRALQKGFIASHIPQQPYVYATQPSKPQKQAS